MKIVFLGLAISSSWGNGHATTYRSLVRALSKLGHEVWFLERDVPWYAVNRDAPEPAGAQLVLYDSLRQLKQRYSGLVRSADLVIAGSFLPSGPTVIDWVIKTARGATAFYDIDTPVTVAKLDRGEITYLAPAQIPAFDVYLSFTGGPILALLQERYGARRAVHLPCSADPDQYQPVTMPVRWTMGYLGTYSADRQVPLERLLCDAARRRPAERFAVAGSQYPDDIRWPSNVDRFEHLGPEEHRGFYSAQRYTVNVTRSDMLRWGWSPSVRLFEAAACAVPIVSDAWPGIEHYFEPGREIIVEAGGFHPDRLPDRERAQIGVRARERVLAEHTPAHRARLLESLFTASAKRAPAEEVLSLA